MLYNVLLIPTFEAPVFFTEHYNKWLTGFMSLYPMTILTINYYYLYFLSEKIENIGYYKDLHQGTHSIVIF